MAVSDDRTEISCSGVFERELVREVREQLDQYLAISLVFPILPDSDFNFSDWLSSDEIARSRQLSNPEVRQRFITCRARLRQLLAACMSCSPNAVKIVHAERGKPMLARSHDSNLQFNVSHSGGWGAIALSTHCPVGVDIENRQQRLNIGVLAQEVFETPMDLEPSPRDANQEKLLVLSGWIAREALFKTLGIGLAHCSFRFPSFRSVVQADIQIDLPPALIAAADATLGQSETLRTSLGGRPDPCIAVLQRFEAETWLLCTSCVLGEPRASTIPRSTKIIVSS